MDLERFTLDSSADAAEVASTLQRFGVVRQPGYVSPSDLPTLQAEFVALLETRAPWVRALSYDAGRAAAVVRKDLDATRFPCTARVFGSAFLRDLGRIVLRGRHVLNEEIWLTRDEPRPEAINPLHFDRIPTLKFLLYLRDADEADGAFRCVPGSHRLGRALTRHHRLRGRRVVDLPNRETPDGLPPAQSISGTAGTLVTFSTDVFHQGGRVEAGHERWVMRGHTRPKRAVAYHPDRTSWQWWVESRLNPLPHVVRAWDRLTGARPPAMPSNLVDDGR